MEKITYEKDGTECSLVIKKPTSKILNRAQIEASKLFADLIREGSVLFRSQLDDYMKKANLWSEENEQELKKINEDIKSLLDTLAKGGIPLKEARDNAIKVRKLRNKINLLLSRKTELDQNTIEGQCENLKVDFIISQCVFDEEGNRVWKTVDEYRDCVEEHALLASNKVISMIYGIQEDFQKKLPENKFLLKYGFVNEDLQYIDEQGRLVDEGGRLIDENGRYINEDGEFVDIDGNRVDEEGNLIVEFTEFT